MSAKGSKLRHIGLISDTHGLLRPEALTALEGCAHIIHAGDIGNPGILAALSGIAPVTPVRGNNHQGEWADRLAEQDTLWIDDTAIFVIHDLAQMPGEVKKQAQVVVSGHSHKPGWQMRDGVLYINPGSAGRRRFKLPISVGRLIIDNGKIFPALMDLENGELKKFAEVIIRPNGNKAT